MCVSLERGNLDWQEKGARAKCKIYHPSSFLPVLGQLHNADMWKRVCFWSALPVSHPARTVQYWRALKRKQWKQSRTKQESKICDPKFIRDVFRKGAIEMKKHRKQECKTYPSHGPFWRVWKRTPEKRCQKTLNPRSGHPQIDLMILMPGHFQNHRQREMKRNQKNSISGK